MSNEFWQYFFGFLGVAFVCWQQNRTTKAVRESSEDANTHAKQVKNTLAETTSDTDDHLDQQDKKLETIHKLVNSALGVPLKALALAYRRTAIESGRKEDIDAAVAAEKASQDHEESQRKLDASLAAGCKSDKK